MGEKLFCFWPCYFALSINHPRDFFLGSIHLNNNLLTCCLFSYWIIEFLILELFWIFPLKLKFWVVDIGIIQIFPLKLKFLVVDIGISCIKLHPMVQPCGKKCVKHLILSHFFSIFLLSVFILVLYLQLAWIILYKELANAVFTL